MLGNVSAESRHAVARLQQLSLLCRSEPDRVQDWLPEMQHLIAQVNAAPQTRRPGSSNAHELHDPLVGQYIEPLMPPDAYINVETIPVVPATKESTPVTVTFKNGPCLIIGLRGTVIDETEGDEAAGLLEMASIGLSAKFNSGRVDIILNNRTSTFARYSDLFVSGVQFSPFLRFCRTTDAVTFQWKNFRKAGGPDLQPTLVLAIWYMDGIVGL